MRPEGRLAATFLLLALCAGAVGCSRVTLLRPDVSRGDFRRTAPEVDVRTDGGARAAALAQARVAQALLADGDATTALETARRALKLDASLPQAHSVVGLSLDALGRAREAGGYHRKAAELGPAQGPLLNNLGTWLCANGAPAESLAWFERAAAAPGYATPDVALANAGLCAIRSGDTERAHAALRRAIAMAPASPVALQALAELELQRGRAFEARAFIERRLAAAPADEASLLLASQIEQRLGDAAAAARYVQRIRAELPRNSDSAREGGNR